MTDDEAARAVAHLMRALADCRAALAKADRAAELIRARLEHAERNIDARERASAYTIERLHAQRQEIERLQAELDVARGRRTP